jgi:hypothetical protein
MLTLETEIKDVLTIVTEIQYILTLETEIKQPLTLETEIKQPLTLETEIKTCTYTYLRFPLFNSSSITYDFHLVDISAGEL